MAGRLLHAASMRLKNGIRLKRRGAGNIARHSRNQNLLDCGGNPAAAGATPLWKCVRNQKAVSPPLPYPQVETGFRPIPKGFTEGCPGIVGNAKVAAALCHRSPKIRGRKLFIETITPIEDDDPAGDGKEISIESNRPDVGAFVSRSGRVARTYPVRCWQRRRHPQEISA